MDQTTNQTQATDMAEDTPEKPEYSTIEEQAVDEWLYLEGDGDNLTIATGDGTLILADTEEYSKRSIRDFEEQLRNTLEQMVGRGLQLLRAEIRKERAAEVEKKDKDLVSLYLPQSGYIVVDTSWDRVMNYSTEGKNVLFEAGPNHPVTFFNTTEEAEAAIKNTRRYLGGIFAWSSNVYIVLPINM